MLLLAYTVQAHRRGGRQLLTEIGYDTASLNFGLYEYFPC
jgi:hypothetical protein